MQGGCEIVAAEFTERLARDVRPLYIRFMDWNTKRTVNADPAVKSLRKQLRLAQIEHRPGIGAIRRQLKSTIQSVLDRLAVA